MPEHRRVEPRQIVGTGMATDPERIQSLEDEKERRERASRPAPEVGFGDVLAKAPAKGTLEGAEAEKVVTPPPAEGPKQALPRVPKDPREAMLRKALAKK